MVTSLPHLAVRTAGLAIVLFVAAPASARHRHPAEEAAHQYRDAIRDFEDHVDDLDHVDRYDERLVERLEDAARELEAASRDRDDLSRLRYHWDEAHSLQHRVEFALFVRAPYAVDPPTQQCWERVVASYARLATEMDCLQGHPGIHSPVPVRGHVGYPVDPLPYSDRVPYGAAYPVGTDRWEHRSDRYPIGTEPRVRGRAITIPSPHASTPPVTHRVDNREAGALVLSSLLNRLLER